MARKDQDYILDIKGVEDPRSEQNRQGDTCEVNVNSKFKGRPWISVFWKCCHVYSRIYRNKEGTAYVGYCPSCSKRVRAKVGHGGTDERFFTAK